MLTVASNPPGLRYLYIAIAGHSYAWYTVYNLFVLWLMSRGVSSNDASAQYGNFVAIAYLLPLLGGAVAVRTGLRTTTLLGAIIATLGYFSIASVAPSRADMLPAFAVGLIVLGCGLTKPNLASMVGRLFPSGSSLADAAYAKYYMATNFGSLFPSFVGGYLAERYSYEAAFFTALFGELVVVAAIVVGRQHLLVVESKSSVVAALGEIETKSLANLGNYADDNVGADPRADVARQMAQFKRKKLIALWIFFAIATFAFWPSYVQNGSGLVLFAKICTNRLVYGFDIPPAWFSCINSIVCIVAAVPLIRLFDKVSLSTSTAIGYITMTLSCSLLIIAPSSAASPLWLIMSIVLSSLSEVLVSTIGLVQVAKLAPRHQTSTYMAIWLLTLAVGGKLAGFSGHLPLQQTFVVLGVITLTAAIVVVCLRQHLDISKPTNEAKAAQPHCEHSLTLSESAV